MTDSTTSSGTERTSENPATLSSIETTLLGATPDDPVEVTDDTVAPVLDAPRTAPLQIVRSFLAEHPELSEKFTQEVDKAWSDAGKQPGEFRAAIAERKAEILTRAELDYLSKQAPQAVADFRGELLRYLVQMEGFAPGSVAQ